MCFPDWQADWQMGVPIFMSKRVSCGWVHSCLPVRGRKGSSTAVEERWHSLRMRVQFTSSIRMGDFIVGSSGDFGPTFLSAIAVETGKVLWQDRRFSRANLLLADGKLVVLDEEGLLGLARTSRHGLEVLAEHQVLTSWSWTTPTLVGSNLYIRDKKTIAKLELPQR